MRNVLFVTAAVMAVTACDSGPAQTTSPSATPSSTAVVTDHVRIGGLEGYPTFLIAGQFPLTATLVKADGSPEVDCTAGAQWTSDDPTVVRMIGPGETTPARRRAAS